VTCIVGIEAPDGVWIGGDSAAMAGWVNLPTRDPKVFANGGFLMGFTTSFRMGQLLHFSDLPKALDRADEDLLRFMCTEFVDGVRQVFKDGGFAKKDNEVEAGGDFLVGVNGALFEVTASYHVQRHLDRYAAIGSGWEIALGALHATRRAARPEQRIRRALAAAAHHSGSVSEPFTILKESRG